MSATQVSVEKTPDYWLILLLQAIRQSDFETAAEARRELRLLGVDIRFANLLPTDGLGRN